MALAQGAGSGATAWAAGFQQAMGFQHAMGESHLSIYLSIYLFIGHLSIDYIFIDYLCIDYLTIYLFIGYLLIGQIERSEWPGNGGSYKAVIVRHGTGAGRRHRREPDR